jgi:lauroyl/myristoyl acyltransferase
MDQTVPQIVTELQSPELELTLTRNAWYSPLSFEAASWIIRHLPRDLSRSLSASIGELGYCLCTTRRAALLRNLDAITQDKTRQVDLSRS